MRSAVLRALQMAFERCGRRELQDLKCRYRCSWREGAANHPAAAAWRGGADGSLQAKAKGAPLWRPIDPSTPQPPPAGTARAPRTHPPDRSIPRPPSPLPLCLWACLPVCSTRTLPATHAPFPQSSNFSTPPAFRARRARDHAPAMSSPTELESRVELLQREIAAAELQLRQLKLDLAEAQAEQERSAQHDRNRAKDLSLALEGGFPDEWITDILAVLREKSVEQHARWPLLEKEYRRYGRQLIMPEVGMQGQLRLKHTSVLIVGVGGLGCPAAAYLAGAGVKALGLVDADTVEESNLHRQILHSTEKVGVSKVDSAIDFLRSYAFYSQLRNPYPIIGAGFQI